MTRVVFAVGHDDTPEAYWRVLVPARSLGHKAVVLHDAREADTGVERSVRARIRASLEAAAEMAVRADVVWVHHPTSERALDVVRRAGNNGARVIVDLSEDPRLRNACGAGQPYTTTQLEFLEQSLDVAALVVVASPELLQTFVDYDVRLVRPAIPLDDAWPVKAPEDPFVLLWWSDGRQRSGWEEVAPEVQEVLLGLEEVGLRSVQYAHLRPVVEGLSSEEAGRLSGRFEAVLEGSLSVDENARLLRRSAQGCYLALESYPQGDYAGCVSDLALLRTAALGVPAVTTRPDPPPGAVRAAPGEWADTLRSLLREPDRRARLSGEARSWAEGRANLDEYQRVLEEV